VAFNNKFFKPKDESKKHLKFKTKTGHNHDITKKLEKTYSCKHNQENITPTWSVKSSSAPLIFLNSHNVMLILIVLIKYLSTNSKGNEKDFLHPEMENFYKKKTSYKLFIRFLKSNIYKQTLESQG